MYGPSADIWDGGCGCLSCCTRPSPFPPRHDDNILEIAGVNSIWHVGCAMIFNKMGFSARQIAQAEEVIIRVRKNMHMQIDGEPWIQPDSLVHIRYHSSGTCLVPLS